MGAPLHFPIPQQACRFPFPRGKVSALQRQCKNGFFDKLNRRAAFAARLFFRGRIYLTVTVRVAVFPLPSLAVTVILEVPLPLMTNSTQRT